MSKEMASQEKTPGTHNVIHEALVATDKTLLPSLYVKLELVK
jgi:hypothetical protein